MRVIVPHESTLTRSAYAGTYLYQTWTTTAPAPVYPVDWVVKYRASSAVPWYDFRCLVAHTSSTLYPPTNELFWAPIGLSATDTAATYESNVLDSNYPTWATGVAVTAGAKRYDPINNHDYIAAIAVASGDNTTAPSVAVVSTDEAIAARWVDAGAANSWAPFDNLTDTYMRGLSDTGSGAAVSSIIFTFDTQIKGRGADALFLSGMTNIGGVAAVIDTVFATADGTVWTGFSAMDKTHSVTGLSYSLYGQSRSSTVIAIPGLPADHTARITLTITPESSGAKMSLSICGLGKAYELANTEWGVEASLLDFSRKERDETYGTVEFIKRGTANRVQATCYIDPTVVNGDVVHMVLRKFTGMPLMLDFNNATANITYDRLLMFGFYTGVKTVINAGTFEVLSMEVEGLAA